MSMMYVGIATAVVSAIGAGVSYAGQQQQAKAQEEAGRAQAEAAAAAARNEEQQTAENIRRERVNKRRRLARMRSQMNAGGVVFSDSTIDVFKETAGNMELGIQDAARAGALDTVNLRNQGSMAAWEARAMARATRVAAYGSLISSASSTASSYAATR